MTLEIYSLILEITRQCNMSCDHCLRGDAQNVDMESETIEHALNDIGNITTISFTGGEPSLNTELIKNTREYCKRKSIPVSQVFIATNGKQISREFMDECDAWHEYCIKQLTNQTHMNGKTLEKTAEMMMDGYQSEYGMILALSADDFHDEIPIESVIRLTSRSYFSKSKFSTETFQDTIRKKSIYSSIQKSGRAKELLDNVARDHTPILKTDWELRKEGETDILYVDTLYVNARGDVLFDCDLSYEDQEKYKVTNVNDPDWTKTLFEHLKHQD